MSVRCELYKLLLTCVKLRSPLKIPFSRPFCWFSNSHGARTVLHLEARKELRRRPKIFNDADAHLTNQLVPNSTTGSILSIRVDPLHPRVQDHRLDVNICSTQDNSEGESATVCFGSIQRSRPKRNTENTRRSLRELHGQNCVFFSTFALKTRSRLEWQP